MITINKGDIAITLRPWQEGDIPSLLKYANNKNIADMMTDSFPHPYGEENAQAFMQRVTGHTPARVLAITMNDEAIGSIGIFPQEDIARLNGEFGYWLAEEHWGKGIATQAVKAMVAYVFENLPLQRIFARPFEHNIGSQKVLERAGFTLEARIPKSLVKNGVIMDDIIYGIRK